MIKELKYKDHDEWLAIRSKYIGGSDASCVVGLNPYKSAYSLWCEKTGKTEPFEGNLTTEIGSFLEEKVAELFIAETGKKVQRKNATMVNDDYPWACANIDRKVVGENAFLEIKTTTSLPTIKKIRDSEFPECYYAQCIHYMAVGSYTKCYLAVLINCRELKIFEMERNQEEIDALMNMEKEFWACVTNDTTPSIDGSSSTTESIKERFPQDNGETVNITALNSKLDALFDLDEQIKALNERKEQIANEIKDYMGNSGKAESDRFSITYTSSSRTTFDYRGYAKDNPGLDLSRWIKTSAVRTFKPKRK